MGKNTAIEWADHSFSAWIGCQHAGPGCDNCYAEAWAKRTGFVKWGPGEPRHRTGADYWKQPLKWDREAAAAGKPATVFCNHLSDAFDNAVDKGWRTDLWALIRETPNLIWIVLTKRIGNAPDMLPEDWGDGYPNVCLVATVVDQDEANRDLPKLLKIPARWRAACLEPLLGPIDLRRIRFHNSNLNAFDGSVQDLDEPQYCGYLPGRPRLVWVILGGESGGRDKVRDYEYVWAIDIIRQCSDRGVPAFNKQLGSRPRFFGEVRALKDRKGRTVREWPADLRVRQIPDWRAAL